MFDCFFLIRTQYKPVYHFLKKIKTMPFKQEDIGALLPISSVLLMIIMIIAQNMRGKVVKRINWYTRIKEGERVLSRGTKFVVVQKQYRHQHGLWIFWYTFKWTKTF